MHARVGPVCVSKRAQWRACQLVCVRQLSNKATRQRTHDSSQSRAGANGALSRNHTQERVLGARRRLTLSCGRRPHAAVLGCHAGWRARPSHACRFGGVMIVFMRARKAEACVGGHVDDLCGQGFSHGEHSPGAWPRRPGRWRRTRTLCTPSSSCRRGARRGRALLS